MYIPIKSTIYLLQDGINSPPKFNTPSLLIFFNISIQKIAKFH